MSESHSTPVPSGDGATSDQARLLAWAMLVGVAGGAAALLLRAAGTALPRLVWPPHGDLVQSVAAAPPLQRLLVPVVGAVLAGLVLTLGERWQGSARGWDILEAVVLRDGILHLRPALLRSLSSLLTVVSGGAVGREGPIVLVSAAVSSAAAQRLGAPTRQRRVLVGCGVAAGLACAYNTPLGAALFAMEILFGSFALDVFAPIVVSSVVATLLTRLAFGNAPVFGAPSLEMVSALEAIPYAILGLLGGALAALFLQALRLSAGLFRRLALPRPVAMALTGLLLGTVLVAGYPEIVGNGREAVAALFARDWSLGYVLALLVLRLVVTPLTVGSGAVGGVFTPTLFVGAMLGYAFGWATHTLMPAIAAPPAAYAVVGMAGLLAGTTHAPMTSVLMVFEMTLDYNLVLPLLLASATASIVATRLASASVYTEALSHQQEAGRGAAVIGVLTARDVMRREQATIPPDLPLPQVFDRFVAERRNHLYVVDQAGAFHGAVNLHDVNRALRQGGATAARADDLAQRRFETVTPEERLDLVLERFSAQECERLPVLEDRRSRLLIGTVSKRDILAVYSLELLQRRGAPPKASALEAPVDRLVDEVPVPRAVVGASFDDARFRERYGVSVLMVRRAATSWLIPDASTRFAEDDRLIVFGPRERLAALGPGHPDAAEPPSPRRRDA